MGAPVLGSMHSVSSLPSSAKGRGLALVLLAMLTGCIELPHIVDPLLSPLGDHDGLAETPAATEEPPEPEASLDLDDGAAWLLLSSGEWLRGSLVRVRRDKLTFRSNRVGEQTFGLGGVRRLVGAGHCVILTTDGRTFEGTVDADEESVWIAGDKTVQIPRSELLGILAIEDHRQTCLLYTSPSPRDGLLSRMPSSA